jgi:predicted hotdog family 3-hydroxylacyl-ACP dehydratase
MFNLELSVPLVEGMEAIQHYIPQRNPFIMVESLWLNDEEKTITSLHVSKENILTENEYLSESALLENMAQTAAVRVGYYCKQNNVEVPVGFITAIKDFKIYHYPRVGQTMYTETVQINEVMNFTIVRGRVYVEEVLMAEAEVRVFINK